MLIVQRIETDPYFNLAAEEYLLRDFSEDCFMLWRNEPSVIIGKHQNAMAEVNHELLRKLELKLVRRISGGGTVYHDLGNINYSFIRTGEKETLVDFKRFTKPVIELLVSLGVEARFEGRNDLRINGLKFSGNAEHVYKNRVLHHGTLLFSSDLSKLNQVLESGTGQYSDKAVKSIRSVVTNISEHLQARLDTIDFMNLLLHHIGRTHPNTKQYFFNALDYQRINDLVQKKYSTWQWNYGYSPDYIFAKEIRINDKIMHVKFMVKNGFVDEVFVMGTDINTIGQEKLKESLTGVAHDYHSIVSSIQDPDLIGYLEVKSVDELAKQFF